MDEKKTLNTDEIIEKVVEATMPTSPGIGLGGSGKPVTESGDSGEPETGWGGARDK